jgi:hypothetical protein
MGNLLILGYWKHSAPKPKRKAEGIEGRGQKVRRRKHTLAMLMRMDYRLFLPSALCLFTSALTGLGLEHDQGHIVYLLLLTDKLLYAIE